MVAFSNDDEFLNTARGFQLRLLKRPMNIMLFRFFSPEDHAPKFCSVSTFPSKVVAKAGYLSKWGRVEGRYFALCDTFVSRIQGVRI
jgi:hypothetical protein